MRITTAQLVSSLLVILSGAQAFQPTPAVKRRSIYKSTSRHPLQQTPQDCYDDEEPVSSFSGRREFVSSAIAAFSTMALASPALANDPPKPPAPAPAPAPKPPAAPAPPAPKPPAPAPAPAPKQPAPKPPAPAPAPAPKPPASSANGFAGSFTDPNHPGGKVTIKPTGQSVGDYRLAEVVGGGGKDEPSSYTLPAVIMGDRTIFIDFSDKGGPKNFVGFLNKDGDVDFLKDGNRWSRVS